MKSRNHRKEFQKYKLNVKGKGIIKEDNLFKLIWRVIINKYANSDHSSRKRSKGSKSAS